MIDRSELELNRAFHEGEAAALAGLVRAHTPRLRAILARRGCPFQEREDLVQRTWLRAWAARDRFDPRRAIGPWIAQIAIRIWVDDLRRSRTRSEAGEVNGGEEGAAVAACPSCTDEGLDRFERDQVLLALASLSPDQREAILLTQYEGLSMREAAQAAGTGVSGVKSRVSRGYSAMRGYLDDPTTRPPLPERRLVELEVAGCERCDEVLERVRNLACPSCEVEIRQAEGDGPRLWVDGREVEGLQGALGYDGTLRALGVGLCAAAGEDSGAD